MGYQRGQGLGPEHTGIAVPISLDKQAGGEKFGPCLLPSEDLTPSGLGHEFRDSTASREVQRMRRASSIGLGRDQNEQDEAKAEDMFDFMNTTLNVVSVHVPFLIQVDFLRLPLSPKWNRLPFSEL